MFIKEEMGYIYLVVVVFTFYFYSFIIGLKMFIKKQMMFNVDLVIQVVIYEILDKFF